MGHSREETRGQGIPGHKTTEWSNKDLSQNKGQTNRSIKQNGLQTKLYDKVKIGKGDRGSQATKQQIVNKQVWAGKTGGDKQGL